jgi:hypothetical protein
MVAKIALSLSCESGHKSLKELVLLLQYGYQINGCWGTGRWRRQVSIFWCFWGYIQRGLVSRVDLITVFLSMESLDSARTMRHLRSRRARLGDSPSILLG